MPTEILTMNRVGVAIALLLIAAWAIRKAGKGLRDELGRRPPPAGPSLTKEQLQAITDQGLASPEQLFAMSPKEQQLLATTALMMRTAQTHRPTREQ